MGRFRPISLSERTLTDHCDPRRPRASSTQVCCSFVWWLVVAAMLWSVVLLSGCSRGRSNELPVLSPAEQNARIVSIADQFAASGDLAAATAQLQALGLADPAQAVLSLAEAYIVQNADPQQTRNLVLLAQALGPLSRLAGEYLARTGEGGQAVAAAQLPPPTPTPVPPTATPTSVPPTATPTAEPTPTPTFTPLPKPQAIVSTQEANVRRGPGTGHPVVARLRQGETVDLIGRNVDGTWWQVALATGEQGWVNASLVSTVGPADAVEVAAVIPTPPPAAAPRPTSPPAARPTQPPPQPAGPPYAFVSYRLRSVGEHSQRCNAGDHAIWVKVVDAAGNPLDGVRVREIYTGQVYVTGQSGPGLVHFDIYRGGGGVVEIVDDANNPVSPQSPGMSADWPPFDLMLAAGYCNCKPHPDPESCRAELENKTYFFAVGHYVYEVVFRRNF